MRWTYITITSNLTQWNEYRMHLNAQSITNFISQIVGYYVGTYTSKNFQQWMLLMSFLNQLPRHLWNLLRNICATSFPAQNM